MSESFTFASYPANDDRNVSTYYGIRIATAPADDCGSPAGESIQIPGRTGALAHFTGAYSNTQRVYQISFPCSTQSEMREKIRNIRQWLSHNHSYCRLTDSFDSAIYRKARCVSPIEFYTLYTECAEANISFDCDPRKFLLTGETEINCTNGGNIVNNYMDSDPIIIATVSGTGTLTLNGITITFSSNPGATIYIDCENMTISNQARTVSYASNVTIIQKFPKLQNGNNTISWTGSISNVKVIPNWWQP